MSNSNTIKRLCHLLGKQPIALALACISAVISVLCNLSAPMIIGNAIDKIQITHDLQQVFPHFILLAIIYLAYALFSWIMMYTSNRIAFSSSCILRKQLHDKMDHLPISFFDSHDRGDLISRYINDIDIISDGLLQGLSTLISGIVTILAAIIFMLSISWQMSIIVILSAPFTYFIAKTITKRSQKYFQAQAATLGAINGFSEEIIAQIKTVKAYDYEAEAFHQFKDMNDQLYRSGVTSQFFGSLANPSTRFITNTAYTCVGVAGAIMTFYQIISIGHISTFLIYSNIFSKPFNEITGIMTQLQSAIASGERIFQLFDEEEEKEKAEVNVAWHGDIVFEHVAFSYDPTIPLMRDVNVHVSAGETVAIVGGTGAGKTTLVNLIMRFYEHTKGCITIDGIDITSLHRNSLRKNIGMVLQDTYLFEGSIADNIAYGQMNATRDDIINAAKKSGAHAFIRHLCHGYDTILHSNQITLSQGERQLLSITRVILKNPAILILDEATSSIDTLSEQRVTNAMHSLMIGKTSFIIAHRLSTILHADQILVMDHGDIVEQGTHELLLKQHGVYAQLYQSQFS